MDIYRKKRELLIENEHKCCVTRGIKVFWEKLKELASNPNLSKERRNNLRDFNKIYYSIYHKDIKNKNYSDFNEDCVLCIFKERYRAEVKLYRYLPEKIKNCIADYRLFALDYVGKQAKGKLLQYANQLRRKNNRITARAKKETAQTEKFFGLTVDTNSFRDRYLFDIAEQDGTVTLKLENSSLCISNGKIVLQESKSVYFWIPWLFYSKWSKIIAVELHRRNQQFEVNFLVENLEYDEQSILWYLTVIGNDMVEIPD